MIFHDVEFLKPKSVAEALKAYADCRERGLEPKYFSGGTELVTMARDGKLMSKALIDLKGIEETQVVERKEGVLRLGSSVILNRLVDAADFPLMAACAGGLADHTVRNSITLGGNIAGMLPYREAILPLLMHDTQVTVAGNDGDSELSKLSLGELFDKRLRLNPGGFLVSFELPESASSAPFWYRRWVRSSRVDYPILTLTAVASGDQLIFATAGCLAYPAWGKAPLSELRSDAGSSTAEKAIASLGTLRSDARASSEYRQALLVQGLSEAAKALS
jgi:xanthine dehydrogenase molybdenum-binding subunit